MNKENYVNRANIIFSCFERGDCDAVLTIKNLKKLRRKMFIDFLMEDVSINVSNKKMEVLLNESFSQRVNENESD